MVTDGLQDLEQRWCWWLALPVEHEVLFPPGFPSGIICTCKAAALTSCSLQGSSRCCLCWCGSDGARRCWGEGDEVWDQGVAGDAWQWWHLALNHTAANIYLPCWGWSLSEFVKSVFLEGEVLVSDLSRITLVMMNCPLVIAMCC